MFEPRYRQLVEDILKADSPEFGICVKASSILEQDTNEGDASENGDSNEFANVGTLSRLQQCEKLPDGRYRILVQGISRFRVLAYSFHQGKNPVRSYDIAEVCDLNDVEETQESGMYKPLRQSFDSFRRLCLEVTTRSHPPEGAVEFLGKAYNDWDLLKKALTEQRNGRDIGCELPWDGEAFMWKCIGCLPVKERAKYRVLESSSRSWRCQEVQRLLEVCNEALRKYGSLQVQG